MIHKTQNTDFIRGQLPTWWTETTLGKIINLVWGWTPKTTVSEYRNGNIPWLSVVDFNDGNRWVSKTGKTITEKGLKESSTKMLKAGDIIISARGTVGALAQLKRDMTFNQSCYGIKEKENISDKNFLYYLLKLSVWIISKNVHGAVFDTITKETFDHINISLPPLTEQCAIATVLSSFDDKIELLREENKALETTAQTIFKEWFGKYKVGNALPEGWRVGKLSEIAGFLNWLALQKFPSQNENDVLPVVKIRELKGWITEQTDKASKKIDPKYIVDDWDILFSWSGSLEVEIWKYWPWALNQHLFKVSSDKYPKRFYYYRTLSHLSEFRQIAGSKAVTMWHIQRHHLDQAKVIIPNDEDLKNLDKLFAPILEKIIVTNSQIQSLAKVRDELLSKLMSGEVRVKF